MNDEIEKKVSDVPGGAGQETKAAESIPGDEANGGTETSEQGSAGALAEMKRALHAAVAERDEYIRLAQRVQADFDNFRRRTRESACEARLDGIAESVSQMLPVMDNLCRALCAEEGDGLRVGVEMIQRQFSEQLAKMGVEEIPAGGMPFNPEVHNAVLSVAPPEGVCPGSVVEVFQQGYRFGDRILRHSMVSVASGE